MTDITPEKARELIELYPARSMLDTTVRTLAEAYLEAKRQLAAAKVLQSLWDGDSVLLVADDVANSLHRALTGTNRNGTPIESRAALGADHERGPDEADALTTPALAGDHEQPNTHYPHLQGTLAGPVGRTLQNGPGDHDQPEHDDDCSSGAGFVDPYCTVCTPGPTHGDHEQPDTGCPCGDPDCLSAAHDAHYRDHEQPTPERTAEVDAAMRDFMGRMFGGPMSGGPHG